MEKGKIKQQQQMTPTNFLFNITAQTKFEFTENFSQINAQDYVIAIVEDIPLRDEKHKGKNIDPVGIAQRAGKVALVEVAQLQDIHTGLHEFFHMLGLNHWWEEEFGKQNETNVMNYAPYASNKLTPQQIGNIFKIQGDNKSRSSIVSRKAINNQNSYEEISSIHVLKELLKFVNSKEGYVQKKVSINPERRKKLENFIKSLK